MSRPRPITSSPWFLGALLLAIAVWSLDLALLRAGVPHPLDDTWEDAIVARLLLEGQGLRTHMIYPPLWELQDPATRTLPVLVHGPLIPLLLAIPVKLGGPRVTDHLAWLGALFAILALIPLFRLAARLYGETVAAAAASLFTLSPLVIDAVNHYLSVLVGACLLTWAIDLLARARPRPFAAGMAAGICYLTRPEMSLAAPILAWLAWHGGVRADDGRDPVATEASSGSGVSPPGWPAVASFALAFAACAAWWWWERWQASGSPFFNLSVYLLASFSPAHPGDGLVRDFTATPGRYPALLAEALPTLWRKWGPFFLRGIKRALSTPSESLGFLAPLGFLAELRARDGRGLVVALGLMAAIPIVLVTLIAPVRLYPVPFAPLYAIAAALGARWLVGRLPMWAHRPRAWLGVLAMLALPWTATEMKEQARQARALERWLAADRAALASAHRNRGNDRRLMFSDTPDFVAWTTERPTVWLTLDEFERLYGAAGADRARGARLPAELRQRPDRADTWFHHGDPRDPEDQAGFRLER
jgi:hypothetical protein